VEEGESGLPGPSLRIRHGPVALSLRQRRGGTPAAERHAAQQVDRQDIYTRITDEIVAAAEASPGRWKRPLHHDGGDVARPVNLASKKRYRGLDVLALGVAAIHDREGPRSPS
jgi:hypothetical protein